ncbi:MAG: sulfotransferase domain-containing protein [Hyphomicrobiales bacterium]
MVHFADLLADLEEEMRRIADFLDISVPKQAWPALLQAAGIDAMRKQGAALMPNVTQLFDKGAETLFNKGTNGRWKGVFRDDDLALYDAKIAKHFSPGCAAWHANGQFVAGAPNTSN